LEGQGPFLPKRCALKKRTAKKTKWALLNKKRAKVVNTYKTNGNRRKGGPGPKKDEPLPGPSPQVDASGVKKEKRNR